jgi:hypothetical protein
MKYLRNGLLGALLALLLVPAVSEARGYLPKWEARQEVVDGVKWMYNDSDDATDWWVEPASRCTRWSRMKVVCDYSMELDYDMDCDSQFGVTLRRSGRKDIFFPGEPDCHYID